MALPPAFLDELRARTPLAPLIGRKARLARNGRQWKGCCPFHNEKTPSFYVYDDHFHCFGCGAHGDAIAFLMRAEGASFPEAVERLAAEAGMEVPKPSPQAAERERRARDLHGVLAAAEAAFRRRLHLPEGRAALDYLRRRGLTEETIARFGLGWSGEGRGALAADLKAAEGIEPAQLIEAGLMKPRDPDAPAAGAVDLFFNRVMFPIRDRRGRTISFGGRILGEGQPKYVNGPETALFQKRRNLYGLDLAREGAFRGARVVVVEGYMDVIALHQAGFVGAVAPLGTALTTDQIDLLWQITPEPILCFDGDKAGLNALIRSSAVALPKLTHEKRVSVILLPLGEDPDTLLSKQGANSFARLLSGSSDFVGTLFRLSTEAANLNTPEGVAAWTRRHDEWVALIENPTMKKSYADFFRDARFKHLRAVRKSSEAVRRRERPERRIGDDTRHLRSERAPVPHRAVDTAGARIERARNLLAVLIRHPILLPEVEEPLAGLDLPEGRCAELRAAILQWLRTADALDSHLLLAQLAQSGLGESAHWATARAGLSPAAAPEAQPGEALDGFWHFFALLRGEEELMADRAEAERQLVATNDPAAQQRLIGLKRALDALRRGEVAEAEPGGVT